MNKQREAVYSSRRQLMEGVAQKQLITEDYVSTILSSILDEFAPEKAHPDQWNTEQIFTQVYEIFGAHLENDHRRHPAQSSRARRSHLRRTQQRYDIKEKILGEAQPPLPRARRHALRTRRPLERTSPQHGPPQGRHRPPRLRQQDPLVDYKQESFGLFEAMMMRFQEDTARNLFRMQILGSRRHPHRNLEQLAQLQRPAATPPTQQLSP